MGNLPTRFWIAQGFGIDDEHQVNAYDNALYHMGLADQNMRYVSSVPPNTQLHDVIVSKGYTFIPPPANYPKKNITNGTASVKSLRAIKYQTPLKQNIRGICSWEHPGVPTS